MHEHLWRLHRFSCLTSSSFTCAAWTTWSLCSLQCVLPVPCGTSCSSFTCGASTKGYLLQQLYTCWTIDNSDVIARSTAASASTGHPQDCCCVLQRTQLGCCPRASSWASTSAVYTSSGLCPRSTCTQQSCVTSCRYAGAGWGLCVASHRQPY